MCGLDQSISFILRGSNEPRFISSGCHPTGMHMIQNPEIETAPNPLNYHIGGSGFFLDEAVIRALGETAERYAQIVSEAAGKNSVVFGTRESLPLGDHAVIDETARRFLTDKQLRLPDCPFEPSGPDSPFGWICAESLVDGTPTWVPTQLFLVGYRVKTKREEPRIWSAVTTGTAVHTDLWAATKSALLELVQIDAAMGHWYCDNTAPCLTRTARTAVVMRLVDRILGGSSASARFHVLPSAGLPGFYIACVLTSDDGSPALGVGLGADTRLPGAIYKSLLEGIAVLQLAKVIRLYTPEDPDETDGGAYSDLNSNVLHYATDPAAMRHLDSKFPVDETVDPEELPADLNRGP